MSKAQQYVNSLIDILSDIKQSYEFNEINILEACNNEQDLLHQIELGTFNACEGYKLCRELQRVRRERRAAKDYNVTMKPLYDYFVKFDGMIKDLQVFKGAIRREQEKLDTRLYKPRIRGDMTIPTLNNVSDLQMKFKKVGAM
ncbi:MAG: hypothetical protein ACYDG2_21160 [Ruminiclostridium sp.]